MNIFANMKFSKVAISIVLVDYNFINNNLMVIYVALVKKEGLNFIQYSTGH